MSPDELLKDLNPQQREAVAAPDGQVLVLAGPGSGKTRVLAYRIAYLVGVAGVRPYHILAVTFTNKAAREMEARLRRLLGDEAEDLWLGTFHAVCARILRREAGSLPFNSNFAIMDRDDQETLMRRTVRELELNDKLYKPSSMINAISTAKDNLILPTEYPVKNYRDEVVSRVYRRYQQLLEDNNSLDFDDLILWTVRLLGDNAEARERYGQRFEHVLVDEFQDTNTTQYELLKLLAGVHRNLFVVGDEDQSIYRWRGADYRNVMRFEEDFPENHKILLEQNYRSTQTVLDAAQAVIDRNAHRTPKHLFSDRGKGNPISLHVAPDDYAEAAYVADTIAQLLSAGSAKGGDFAVMYRTNAQSRLLEEAFLRAGIPYRLVGAQRFYGRREVKDLVAYLRLVENPNDEISLLRAITNPPRGIGDKTLVALQLAARQTEKRPGEVLLDLGQHSTDSVYWERFRGHSAVLLADFGALLGSWIQAAQALPLPALFDRIVDDIGYHDVVDDGTEEGQERWANVTELRRLTYEYQERGLGAFLEAIALASDQDTIPEQLEAPTLLTLHAAKGLEFPYVFITGLDEGLLPHSRALDDPEEMAEERRLFYVGVTRAKDRLYLVRAKTRSTYGPREVTAPSRFLKDIPSELLVRSGESEEAEYVWRSRPRRASEYPQAPAWEPPAPPVSQRPKPPAAPHYPPNTRILHPTWGEGLVLNTTVQPDGEETVDVYFESVGLKHLLASIAPLQVLP